MFNDKFGLTEAVLNGKKTMTRRIVSEKLLERWSDYEAFCNSVCTEGIITERQYYNEINFYLDNSKYKIGEVVAVAQSYKNANVRYLPEEDEEFGCYNFPADQTKGWDNKMFVRADLMPHQIQITDISIQKLRDISDEDVIKEGFSLEPINDNNGSYAFHHEYMLTYLDKMGLSKEIRDRSAKDAYSLLIDKIYPNLLWENPYVFTYDFKLIK
jgi:hypothetical protein